MPRYGMFLNESEDADLIKILENRNVSLFLKTMFREYLYLKQQKELSEKIESLEKIILFKINRTEINLERMIENKFLKLEKTQTTKQIETNKEIVVDGIGEFEQFENYDIEV